MIPSVALRGSPWFSVALGDQGRRRGPAAPVGPDSARARLRRTAVLILDPADAHAAGGDPAVGHLFERIQRTVLHQVA